MKKISLRHLPFQHAFLIFAWLLTLPQALAQKSLSEPDTIQWQLVFSDDFNGAELNRDLWHTYGNWAGMESDNWSESRYAPDNHQIYLDDQVVLDSGICHLLLSRKAVSWRCDTCAKTQQANYAAGEIFTYYTRPFLYGRYEARLKMPAAANTHATFWLWPGFNISEDQGIEIDIAEGYGGPARALPFSDRGNRHANYSVHRWGPAGHAEVRGRFPFQTWWQALNGSFFDISDWHTYTFEWEPGEVRFYTDGRLVRTYTTADIPWLETDARTANLRLTMALDKPGNEPPGIIDIFRIDYVRVWERKTGFR